MSEVDHASNWDRLIFALELAVNSKINMELTTSQCKYLLDKLTSLTDRVADLEAERRWIPVSERLPEVEEYACSVSVLVFRNGYTVAEAWYDFEEENWHKSNAIGMLIDGVTHWMPLPEPPDDYVGDSDHEHDDRIL